MASLTSVVFYICSKCINKTGNVYAHEFCIQWVVFYIVVLGSPISILRVLVSRTSRCTPKPTILLNSRPNCNYNAELWVYSNYLMGPILEHHRTIFKAKLWGSVGKKHQKIYASIQSPNYLCSIIFEMFLLLSSLYLSVTSFQVTISKCLESLWSINHWNIPQKRQRILFEQITNGHTSPLVSTVLLMIAATTLIWLSCIWVDGQKGRKLVVRLK